MRNVFSSKAQSESPLKTFFHRNNVESTHYLKTCLSIKVFFFLYSSIIVPFISMLLFDLTPGLKAKLVCEPENLMCC